MPDIFLLLERKQIQFIFGKMGEMHLLFRSWGEAIVEEYPSVIVQDSRVEHKALLHRLPSQNVRGIVHMAVVLKRPAGHIADCHAYFGIPAVAVIEIKASVRPLRHIRCPEMHPVIGVAGILVSPVALPFTAPVFQIVCWRRPDCIMLLAVCGASGAVVGTVDIQSPPKYMGLAIRDVFIKWQIGG